MSLWWWKRKQAVGRGEWVREGREMSRGEWRVVWGGDYFVRFVYSSWSFRASLDITAFAVSAICAATAAAVPTAQCSKNNNRCSVGACLRKLRKKIERGRRVKISDAATAATTATVTAAAKIWLLRFPYLHVLLVESAVPLLILSLSPFPSHLSETRLPTYFVISIPAFVSCAIRISTLANGAGCFDVGGGKKIPLVHCIIFSQKSSYGKNKLLLHFISNLFDCIQKIVKIHESGAEWAICRTQMGKNSFCQESFTCILGWKGMYFFGISCLCDTYCGGNTLQDRLFAPKVQTFWIGKQKNRQGRPIFFLKKTTFRNLSLHELTVGEESKET